jgi:H+/Cl- antiporter ClcA
VAIVWLIIPDIIKSVALTQRYGWWDETAYISFGVLFNMQTFSSFASLIAIFIYIMVLIATIKLCVTSQIKFKYWELVFYIFTLGILFVIFTYHYYNLIDKAIQAYTHNTSNQDKIKVITGLAIELGTTIAICAFFFGWYKAHYNKILHTRTKIQQKRLDKAFQRIQLATN